MTQENEAAYTQRINLQFVADNMPILLDKIIAGMPVRLSSADVQLLETALDCARYEVTSRANRGRPKIHATDAEKSRAWRERNKLKK